MNKNSDTYLQPLNAQKKKFCNQTLFERREREQLELLNKPLPKKDKLSKIKPKELDTRNNLYITEKPYQTTEIDKFSKTGEMTSHYRTMSTTDATYNKDIRTLKEIESNSKKQMIDEKFKTQIDFKTKTFHRRKESVKDFIEKTRELMLIKHTAHIKQERAIRLKETYENEVESINDTIKSLKQAQTLFNDTFYVKFGEYIKHLSNQREIEKSKNTNLLEETIKFKNEISQIQSKIRKIEQDKANVIRWLYFQIQLKEKLITLPSHYKKIIEQDEISSKLNSELNVNSNTGNITDRLFKRKATKLPIQKSFITQEEKEKVMQYKAALIYNTPDEFLSQLKKYEDENIVLINKYNELS